MFDERVGPHIRKGVLPKLRAQIREGVAAGTIAPMTAEQFLITILSACIFPFAARALLTTALDLGEKGFERLIEQRRKELPEFLKRAIQP